MNSKNLKALSYSNIASCYQKMGKHNEAMKYFRDARKEYRNPSQRKEGNYEMWNSISYLNRIGAEKELIDNETVVLVQLTLSKLENGENLTWAAKPGSF